MFDILFYLSVMRGMSLKANLTKSRNIQPAG